jgi:hypothetical protein
MKRITFVAAAAMLFAGAQLHAQATKQDTTKKAATVTAKPMGTSTKPHKSMAKPAGTTKMAAKPDSTKKHRKSSGKKKPVVKKDTTAKKP